MTDLSENERLRKIISDCAKALGNGAFVSPEASIEFMEEVPKEISLVVARLSPPPGPQAISEIEPIISALELGLSKGKGDVARVSVANLTALINYIRKSAR